MSVVVSKQVTLEAGPQRRWTTTNIEIHHSTRQRHQLLVKQKHCYQNFSLILFLNKVWNGQSEQNFWTMAHASSRVESRFGDAVHLQKVPRPDKMVRDTCARIGYSSRKFGGAAASETHWLSQWQRECREADAISTRGTSNVNSEQSRKHCRGCRCCECSEAISATFQKWTD